MNELTHVQGMDLAEVVKNPALFPEETVAAALDFIKRVAGQWYENKMRLENYLINEMEKENASKIIFVTTDGNEAVATLKAGTTKCDVRAADDIYKEQGFDPLEIGEYVFKPSWTKAKEARKFGGEKQLVIDELFKPGRASLTITEK